MGTENAVVEDKKPTPEEQAQIEKDAEAGFAAGFKKVRGEEQADATKTDTTSEKSDAEKEEEARLAAEEKAKTDAAEKLKAEEKAKTDAAAKVDADRKFLEGLPERMRRMEGTVGGLAGQLKDAVATVKAAATKSGADAPTDKQIAAAMSDPEGWKKLEEDFPDWAAPVKAEFAAVRAELNAELKKAGGQVDVKAIKESVKGEVRAELAFEAVEDVHEGWQGTVQTPQFKAWLPTQSEDVQKLALSQRPRDAIKLLDTYAEHAKTAASADPTKDAAQKKQKRLSGAVTPQGGPAPAETGLSDDEAFATGFKKVMGQKNK